MASFVQEPIEVDKDELAQEAYEAIQAQFPDWQPAEGNFEAFFIEILCQLVATLMQVASDVPASIFRYFGRLVGVNPIDATAASVNATITVRDAAGYTVPAGTNFSIPAAGDQLIGFATQNELVIPPGSTTGDVVLISQVEGAIGSDLSGPATLVDALAFVTGVALDGVTSGGQDGEDDPTYLNRLAAQLRLMLPRPVYPDEFATFARSVPGVYRAKAINNYNPIDDTDGNAGHITIALMNSSGTAVSDEIKAVVMSVVAPNEGVLGLIVHMIDPHPTDVHVIFTGKAYAGWDPAVVNANAEAAVLDFLNPAKFASGQVGSGQEPVWENELVVRFQDVSAVLNSVAGFNYWETLTINGGTADVALTGRAAVPGTGSTAAGTVTGP